MKEFALFVFGFVAGAVVFKLAFTKAETEYKKVVLDFKTELEKLKKKL